MPASKIVAAVGAAALAALMLAAPRLPVSRVTTTPADPSCPANAKKANLNFTLKNFEYITSGSNGTAPNAGPVVRKSAPL